MLALKKFVKHKYGVLHNGMYQCQSVCVMYMHTNVEHSTIHVNCCSKLIDVNVKNLDLFMKYKEHN